MWTGGGLSQAVVQQELRTRLGFTGVTITNALETGAISSYGTDAELGVLAAQAGMTCCWPPPKT